MDNIDFDSAIFTSLFSDYPLGHLISLLVSPKSKFNAFFAPVEFLLQHRLKDYTLTDAKDIVTYYKAKWNKGALASSLKDVFKDVADIAGFLLDANSAASTPKVKFEELLRWKRIAMPISEDLLVTSLMAKNNQNRNDFIWSDCLSTTGDKFNLESKELKDLHAHLSSSADSASLNWIILMNAVGSDIPILKLTNLDILHNNGILKTINNPINVFKEKYAEKSYFGYIAMAQVIRYMLYRFSVCGDKYSKDDIEDFNAALDGGITSYYYLKDIYAMIDTDRWQSLRLRCKYGKHWDYAIPATVQSVTSPYILLHGERFVLYSYFRKLFNNDNDAVKYSPYFLLYILIKNKVRLEFIMNNQLLGLENYQQYEHTKSGPLSNFSDLKKQYSIQTSISTLPSRLLEGRINGGVDANDAVHNINNLYLIRPEKVIIDDTQDYFIPQNTLKSKFSLILSVSKPNNSGSRRSEMLNSPNVTDIMSVFAYIYQYRNYLDHPICGIDFAGSDTKASPECFGTAIRYGRWLNVNNFTYHIGENFYDLIDGLRNLWQLLHLLEWKSPNRISHALCLGTNSYSYYGLRDYNVVMPKQILLDNLVWLLKAYPQSSMQLSNKSTNELKRKINELFNEIGYRCTLDNYYKSMFLRGDNPNIYHSNNVVFRKFPFEILNIQEAIDARKSPSCININNEYWHNPSVFTKGNKICQWKYPKDIRGVVKSIQQEILEEVSRREIVIECCPTSNYSIGYFNKYDEIPFFKFLNNQQVTINTDIKGIVSTNIQNEYAYVALAQLKKGKSSRQISQWIDRCMQTSANARFT